MKWFQVDSDTPNDPKIRAVNRELGREGLGGLFCVWCHIADHGAEPGRSVDATGKPFPIEELVEVSGLCSEKFSKLIEICTESGHFEKKAWDRQQVVSIPAMRARADTYTKRKVRRD